MVAIRESRMEVLFGFIGALFVLVGLLLTAFLTPGFTPLIYTISSLGEGNARSLFSISFVVAGCLLIPFYIYLKKELIAIEEHIRKLATGIAIFSNMCIALVGIIPNETFDPVAFYTFHGVVAAVSFIGTSIYIVLYSILMYKGPQSLMYKGPSFKRYLAYLGFIVGFMLVLFLVTFKPIIEWVLALLTVSWIFLVFLYPVIGIALGHCYPETCMPMAPCPLTIFAIALAAAAIPKVDRKVYVFLLPWAILSLPKCLGALDCYEDCILFAAGVYGLVLLVKNWKTIGGKQGDG